MTNIKQETYILVKKEKDRLKIEIEAGAIEVGLMIAKIIGALPNVAQPIALLSFAEHFKQQNPLSDIKVCAGNKEDVLNLLKESSHDQKFN